MNYYRVITCRHEYFTIILARIPDRKISKCSAHGPRWRALAVDRDRMQVHVVNWQAASSMRALRHDSENRKGPGDDEQSVNEIAH
jgi:hypothetical protein